MCYYPFTGIVSAQAIDCPLPDEPSCACTVYYKDVGNAAAKMVRGTSSAYAVILIGHVAFLRAPVQSRPKEWALAHDGRRVIEHLSAAKYKYLMSVMTGTLQNYSGNRWKEAKV